MTAVLAYVFDRVDTMEVFEATLECSGSMKFAEALRFAHMG